MNVILKLIGTQGSTSKRATTSRRGVFYPNLFSKIEESALILETYALFVLIYRLNFSFKMLFEVHPGEKTSKFFPAGPCFRVA